MFPTWRGWKAARWLSHGPTCCEGDGPYRVWLLWGNSHLGLLMGWGPSGDLLQGTPWAYLPALLLTVSVLCLSFQV